MSKIVHHVYLDQGKVIVHYEEEHVFHFCRDCQHEGKHFFEFFSYFYPEVKEHGVNNKQAARFERRLYFNIAHGVQRAIRRETELFIAYAQRYLDRMQKKQEKAARKAERLKLQEGS